MAAAAVESNGESPTDPGYETAAHSPVLVDTTISNIIDVDEIAKGLRRQRGGRWKGNRRTPGTSKVLLNPALAIGTTVNGSIAAKIDSAYLITAVVEGEELKGVLYHVLPKYKVKQFTKVMAPPVDLQAADIKSKSNSSLRRRRRKLLRKDRNAPKKNRTGYNFFFAEERLRLKASYPDMRAEREISRAIGEAWNSLSQEQKKPYQELGAKDKERYRDEMREYVYQRLRKLKPLTETEADGAMPLEENGSVPLVIGTLSLNDQDAASTVRIEDVGSNPSIVECLSAEKLAPVAEPPCEGA